MSIEKCPICKLKYLVGGHEVKCRKDYPAAWFNYLYQNADVSKNRLGRTEQLAQLRGK